MFASSLPILAMMPHRWKQSFECITIYHIVWWRERGTMHEAYAFHKMLLMKILQHQKCLNQKSFHSNPCWHCKPFQCVWMEDSQAIASILCINCWWTEDASSVLYRFVAFQQTRYVCILHFAINTDTNIFAMQCLTACYNHLSTGHFQSWHKEFVCFSAFTVPKSFELILTLFTPSISNMYNPSAIDASASTFHIFFSANLNLKFL